MSEEANIAAIRAYMREHRLNIKRTAAKLGVHQSTISNVLNGASRVGPLLAKKARALGIDLSIERDNEAEYARERARMVEMYPASEGWMWYNELQQRTGVGRYNVGNEFNGFKWETSHNKHHTRYRIVAEGVTTPLCDGCHEELSLHRTYLIANKKICLLCHRRAFSDYEFGLAIGVM